MNPPSAKNLISEIRLFVRTFAPTARHYTIKLSRGRAMLTYVIE